MKIKLTLPLALALILTTSAVTSVVASVFTSRSLDRYVERLNSELALDSRYLGSVRNVSSGDVSSLDTLARVREQSLAGLRLTVPAVKTWQQAAAAPFLTSGVVLTSDGWLIFPTPENNVGNLQNSEVVIDSVIYPVEKIVRDDQHQVMLAHVKATNLVAVTYGNTAAMQAGEQLYLADAAGLTDIARLIGFTYANSLAPLPDYQQTTTWQVASGLMKGGVMFDNNMEFAGFMRGGKALPLHSYLGTIQTAISSAHFIRASLGANIVDTTRVNNLDAAAFPQRGAIIVADARSIAVIPDGPAAKAGLQPGDTIVGIDGQMITANMSLATILAGFHAGDKVTVAYWRAGVEASTDLTLGSVEDLLY